MNDRCYSELIKIQSFEERYRYLKLDGKVGVDTFGFDRYLNQALYTSQKWKRIRDIVIVRDNGCDLGVIGHEIHGRILIHHMNPIDQKLILERDPIIFDPEYLICVTHVTHNAIHYGDERQLRTGIVERSKNDTCPWRK